MVIGWVMVLFAFLVMFFQPAAAKLGESRFQIIAAVLVLAGPGAECDWRACAGEESLTGLRGGNARLRGRAVLCHNEFITAVPEPTLAAALGTANKNGSQWQTQSWW